MLTITELNDIRARVRQNLSVRRNGNDVRIIIGSGTAAIAAGSRQLMTAALEEMALHSTANVQVSQRELDVEAGEHPAVVVAINGSEVLYKRCTAAELRTIIGRSILGPAANAN